MGCLKLTYYENESPLKVVRENFLSEEKADVGAYRYGFNGKEKDDSGEFGSTAHYDYGFRIYNPSIGRFLSVDPLFKGFPWLTPYQFASNRPIVAIDLDGLESSDTNKEVTQSEPNSKVAEQLMKNVQQQIVDGTIDCQTQTACYPTVWKRVMQAYEDVYGKGNAPSQFYTTWITKDKNGNYIDAQHRSYPTGRTVFKILSASEFGSPKWKDIPEEYRAKGVAGAMVHAGLADMVDDVWSGALKPGAVLQMWTSQEDYEGIKSGKGYDKESNTWYNEWMGLEDYGHSAIFVGYKKNFFEKITGLKIVDQRGETTISKDSWKYPVAFGANIKDKSEPKPKRKR
jgi:RHS repeat-associated protein